MSDICVRCHVSGRVQGVWFRAATQEQAQALGVRGFARNLADGRVEVLACGSTDAVDSMVSWLAKGPPMARVRDVERTEEALPADGVPTDFEVW